MNIAVKSEERYAESVRDHLHTLAHDLREPLRCVNSIFQFLVNSNQEKFDNESMHYVEIINNNMSILNDFILYTLGNFEHLNALNKNEAINLQNLVDDVHKILYIQLKEKKCVIEIMNDLPTVVGNPVQIRQVFTNIIDNSLKYKKDKPPFIRISATKKNGFVEFGISDNGIGIAHEQLENCFEKFNRLNVAESTTGSGIGLWICKKIIESHGGKITAGNNPHGGALFTFSLPMA
jgi:light-regulated signal transduction histidine kinase (bacteriophytochrome)